MGNMGYKLKKMFLHRETQWQSPNREMTGVERRAHLSVERSRFSGVQTAESWSDFLLCLHRSTWSSTSNINVTDLSQTHWVGMGLPKIKGTNVTLPRGSLNMPHTAGTLMMLLHCYRTELWWLGTRSFPTLRIPHALDPTHQVKGASDGIRWDRSKMLKYIFLVKIRGLY